MVFWNQDIVGGNGNGGGGGQGGVEGQLMEVVEVELEEKYENGRVGRRTIVLNTLGKKLAIKIIRNAIVNVGDEFSVVGIFGTLSRSDLHPSTS